VQHMLQHSLLCASSVVWGSMDNTSTISSLDDCSTFLNSKSLAQQQQFDAACLVYKVPANSDVRELVGSPTTGGDLASQQHKVSVLCHNDSLLATCRRQLA
jgi:hypothetical protein